VSSYLLVNIILQSPAGKLGDIVGRRRAFMIGLSLFAIGALIAILAPYLPVVATSRVLMAAGGAMLVPNAMALLRNVIPEHRRSSAFGYFGALLSASAAVGPMLGGMLTEYFGWKAIFLVNLPLLLISWVLVKSDTSYVRPTADSDAARPRFDFIGMGLLCLSLCILVIGLKSDDFWPVIAVVLGTLGLVVFTRWEKFTRHPLVDVQLFRRRPFVIGGVIVGLQNLGMYALLFQLPFLLKAWYQLDPAKTGQILLWLVRKHRRPANAAVYDRFSRTVVDAHFIGIGRQRNRYGERTRSIRRIISRAIRTQRRGRRYPVDDALSWRYSGNHYYLDHSHQHRPRRNATAE
jgi:MFS family permease